MDERTINARGLTRKQLAKAANCPPYLVDYYRECGYLPVLRHSPGPGTPVLFDPSAVSVIKKRQEKKRPVPAGSE